MPDQYQQCLDSIPIYEPPEGRRGKAGAAIFFAFWGPIMGFMEKLTKATISGNGIAPYSVILLVRFTMVVIWFTHDVLFAPLFGRGDGNEVDKVAPKQEPLLEKGNYTMYYIV
jgi:hypothetical protein